MDYWSLQLQIMDTTQLSYNGFDSLEVVVRRLRMSCSCLKVTFLVSVLVRDLGLVENLVLTS